MQDAGLTLNGAWLRNRVAELGLKHWWLAEQIGVDRKTVQRWLNGHVRTIRAENARALAGVLDCRVEALLLHDDTAGLATPDDQAHAATLLAAGRLIERLGPVGDWDVIESLIKATVVPQLPLHVLATLYDQLCIASWRQSKLDAAETYNRAALELAQRCDDKALIASSLRSRANLLHWRGDCAAAQACYREVLALAPYLDARALASTLSNLGASLYEAGALDEGRELLQRALALLRVDGTPMQLSIARTHLALLALRCGALDEADEHARQAEAHARPQDYRRGLAITQLLQAEIAARRGDATRARATLNEGRARFAALGIEEGLNEEIAGRVLRMLGDLDAALAALRRGLRWAAEYPLQHAMLRHELALTLKAAGDAAAAEAERGAAVEGFQRCGARAPE